MLHNNDNVEPVCLLHVLEHIQPMAHSTGTGYKKNTYVGELATLGVKAKQETSCTKTNYAHTTQCMGVLTPCTIWYTPSNNAHLPFGMTVRAVGLDQWYLSLPSTIKTSVRSLMRALCGLGFQSLSDCNGLSRNDSRGGFLSHLKLKLPSLSFLHRVLG